MMDQRVEPREAAAGVTPAKPKSRIILLVTLLNVVLMGGLLYKIFGESLSSSNEGVTLALINYTAGPMLDVTFEYPGGKLAMPKIGVREQVGHSVSNIADFDATLRFKDEQGHVYKETVPVRAYNGLLLLLAVQPILETSVIKTAEGKEETVVKASPDKVFVVKSYQKPGLNK